MKADDTTSFWLVLLLWAAGLGAAGQFAKVAVIFAALQQAYPDAGPALGFVVSLISLLGIAFGLFTGMVVARLGSRPLLLAALALGAALSAWQATLPALPILLASRVIEGLSHLVIVVAAPTLITQVSAARHRAFAMTLWSTFFGVAFAVVAWLGLPLVAARGPGSLFLAHAGFMATVALLLLLMLPTRREPPRGEPPLELTDVLRRHVGIYRSPWEAAPAIGWLFYTLTFVSLLTVLPGLLAAEHRAMVTGFMPLAGIATSLTIGVVLLRYLAAVHIVMLGFGLAALVMLLLVVFPANPWLCIGLFGVLGLVQGASFAAIPQLNPTVQGQAHANGALAQMGNLGNTCGTPILLALIGVFGETGPILFAFASYACGMTVHIVLAHRRWTS